jgi:hypothetical protein
MLATLPLTDPHFSILDSPAQLISQYAHRSQSVRMPFTCVAWSESVVLITVFVGIAVLFVFFLTDYPASNRHNPLAI